MTVNSAPLTQPVIDENAYPTLPWTLFFNQMFEGDAGKSWIPTFQSFTGTATFSGRFYRLSQYLVFFTVKITPSGNTSTTSGSTYIDNFPLNLTNDGFNTVVSGAAGGAIGMNRASDNRIYVPQWTNVSVPLTIIGIGEAT